MAQATKSKTATPFVLTVEDVAADEAPASKRRGETGEKMQAFDNLIRSLTAEKPGVKLPPKGDQTVRGLALSLTHAVKRLKLRKEDVKPGEAFIDVTTGVDTKDGKDKAWATRRIKPEAKA